MIEFTEDYRVKPDGPDYLKGSRHSMRAASEAHFVRKGVAVQVEPSPEKKPPVAEEAESLPAAEQEAITIASPPAPVLPEKTAKGRGKLKAK